MLLYITRHGKTLWNIEGRFQGVKDSPLTESGIRDAKALGNYIKDISFQAVYTSPLGRAKATTSLIFVDRPWLIQEEPLIQEMNFGVFEGMKTSEISQKYKELYDNLWNHPDIFTRCPGGGESYAEVTQRVKKFLSNLTAFKKNDSVFITTHGMYFIVLMGYIKGLAPIDFPKINRYVVRGCSLTCVEIDSNHFRILQEGDEHFLVPEEKSSFLIKK